MTSYPGLNPVAASPRGPDNLRMSGDPTSPCRFSVMAIGAPSLAPEGGVVRVGRRAVRRGCGRVTNAHLQWKAHRTYKNETQCKTSLVACAVM